MRSRTLLRTSLAVLACLLSLESSAATVSGTIESLYFSGKGNYAVRVVINGVTDPCGNGGSSFAFIDDSLGDSNYNVFVAALMLAKAQNSTINMTVGPATSNNAVCHLIEFNM
jgi:hypothetical protein